MTPATQSPIPADAISGKAEIPREEPAPAKGSFHIPPILLQGDKPPAEPAIPPRELPQAPKAAEARREPESPQLPEAYGTERLLLTARDPHCLYAHWDFTAAQQEKHAKSSAHRHLVLRVQPSEPVGQPMTELHLHPDVRHCFVPVDAPGSYTAELGYYQPGQEWKPIARSEPANAPGATPSRQEAIRFAALAPAPPLFPEGFRTRRSGAEFRFSQVGSAVQETRAADEDIQRGAHAGGRAKYAEVAAPPWSPIQQRTLSRLLAEGQQLISSAALPQARAEEFAHPAEVSSLAPLEGAGVSSPLGAEAPGRKAFWFNVNAELVVYGATEPGAQVTLGGRRVALRPDGTFSFRFALPDGSYTVPLAATAVHGEVRQVELIFARATEHGGGVGVQPQDPALETPATKK